MFAHEPHFGPESHKEDVEAVKIFAAAAREGYARAAYWLGCMYEVGEGAPQDYDEALKWYRLAADQGETRAQYRIGCMYQQGLGVACDFTEALAWYQRAAAQGHAAARFHVGSMYENGCGVARDAVAAYVWYRLAEDSLEAAPGDAFQASGEQRLRGLIERLEASLTQEDLAAARLRLADQQGERPEHRWVRGKDGAAV